MNHKALLLCACLALTVPAPGWAAPPPEREPTDIYIRRLAGLGPETANGDIQIIDVGHMPLSPMISLVASRRPEGTWRVSYACAESPHCADPADHDARTYDLAPADGAKVDAILTRLRAGEAAAAPVESAPPIACGHLLIVINLAGFQRDYRRSCASDPALGELETLLQPPPA